MLNTLYIGEPQLRRVIFNRQPVRDSIEEPRLCICIFLLILSFFYTYIYIYIHIDTILGFTIILVGSAQHERILLIIWYYKYIVYLFFSFLLYSLFDFFLSAFLLLLLIIERNKQDGRGSIGMLIMEGQRFEVKRWSPFLFQKKYSLLYLNNI